MKDSVLNSVRPQPTPTRMPGRMASERKAPVLALIAGIGSAPACDSGATIACRRPKGFLERALQPDDLRQLALDGDLHLVARPRLGEHAHNGNAPDAQHIGDFVLSHLLDEIHPGGADAEPVGAPVADGRARIRLRHRAFAARPHGWHVSPLNSPQCPRIGRNRTAAGRPDRSPDQ